MKSLFRTLAYLTVFILAAATAFRGVQAQSGQQAPAPSDPTFKVEVNYVEEDVRVVDRAGNFIRGLTAQDFQVTEDGVPQRVSTFTAVDIPFVPRERPSYADASAPPLEPDVATNIQGGDGRLYLIVLDDYHISPMRTSQTRQLARRFILERLGTNDYAAVLVTSGNANATQDFTQNRQLLLKAVDRFSGQKLPAATLALLDARQQQEGGRSTRSQEDPDAMERVANARSTMRSLSSIAEWMTPIRGRRKAIVYISEGVDNFNYFDVFGSRDYPIGDSQNTNSREAGFDAVRQATWDAAEAAARANVQIYPVDPRGLTTGGSDDIMIGGLPSGAFTVGPASLGSEIRTSQDNLRQLAEQTGGVAAVNTNDFEKAFARIVEENSSYYVLGYYATNEKRDGKMRTVSIRVPSRPDAQLSYRHRYAVAREKTTRATPAKPGDAQRELSAQLGEMMASPLPQTGLTMRVSAIPHKGTGKNAALDLVIEAFGSALQFKEGGGTFQDTVSFSVRAYDRQGKSAAGERFDLDLKLKPESHELVKEHGVRVIRTLPIPPGQYGLRIAAQDSVGMKRGSVRFDVEVPDFSKDPIGMSGIALASAASPAFSSWNKAFAEGLPAAPTASRNFPAGDTLAAYIELYDNKPVPTHRLDITTTVKANDGKVVFTHRDERSTEELHGTPGGFGYDTRIPLTDWTPGLYVLTIEVKARLANSPAVSRVVPFRVR